MHDVDGSRLVMHWFTEAIQHRYALFTGRARRTEYWMFYLIWAAFYVAAFVVDFAIIAATGLPVPVFTLLFALGTLVPSLAILVRRLHDTNRSAWWLLLGLVPFGGIVLFVFLVIEGDRGPNAYGPDPKDPTGTGGAVPWHQYGEPQYGTPHHGTPHYGPPQ